MTLTDEQRVDYADLMTRPQFRRFMLRVIQLAGIFDASANGSAERTFRSEGRRSLGLELLRELDAAQPAPSPTSIPTLTAIQLLHEDAQSAPNERTKSGRRNGIYGDLGTDDGNGGDDD